MAEHFADLVRERLHALETRVETDSRAVQEHFVELRTFITEALDLQIGRLRDELRAEIGQLRDELRGDVGGLRADMAAIRSDLRDLTVQIAGLVQRLDAR